MDVVALGESRVAFLPVVRGLVREEERVRQAIQEVAPEAVAMTVGREELDTLAVYDGAEAEPANWEEEMYVAGLRQWGEVRKPPPCFIEAVRTANFTTADANITCRYVGLRAYITEQLSHKALAKPHNLIIAFTLGIKVRAAFAAAHRQSCKRILKHLLETEEF